MKKWLFIPIVIVLLFCNSRLSLHAISTVLLVIEETENEFVPFKEITPFSDGLFTAMWETPYIFFDMQIDKPIPLFNESLDIRSYMEEVKSSGADSLLLVKLTYQTYEEKSKLYLKITDIPYLLYSTSEMKLIKSGKKIINIDKQVENNSKNQILKDIGLEIVDLIFN